LLVKEVEEGIAIERLSPDFLQRRPEWVCGLASALAPGRATRGGEEEWGREAGQLAEYDCYGNPDELIQSITTLRAAILPPSKLDQVSERELARIFAFNDLPLDLVYEIHAYLYDVSALVDGIYERHFPYDTFSALSSQYYCRWFREEGKYHFWQLLDHESCQESYILKIFRDCCRNEFYQEYCEKKDRLQGVAGTSPAMDGGQGTGAGTSTGTGNNSSNGHGNSYDGDGDSALIATNPLAATTTTSNSDQDERGTGRWVVEGGPLISDSEIMYTHSLTGHTHLFPRRYPPAMVMNALDLSGGDREVALEMVQMEVLLAKRKEERDDGLGEMARFDV
jgi:hypothetical protein